MNSSLLYVIINNMNDFNILTFDITKECVSHIVYVRHIKFKAYIFA